MKKNLLTTSLLLNTLASIACPVCERNQPKILKGITHGAGPETNWDYVIVGVMSFLVLATLIFSVKWLIRPGEQSEHHIKRFILNNN